MQRHLSSASLIAPAIALFCGLAWGRGLTQTIQPAPSAFPAQDASDSAATAPKLPDAPNVNTLHLRSAQTPDELEASRIASLTHVNGRPYQRPSHRDQFDDYLRDSYGWPAFARSTARALYSEARGGPKGWGQDFPGFAQRYGSNVAITAIDGNVRYGMETIFHEDMRYIPCHGCSVKIGNALLAEVTARHDSDGHRFFTLTPVIADFSGPIIANTFWYPNHDPFGGVIGTRTVAAARVGGHLFTEFVWERRHHDPKFSD